jgi:hypothetical protein
MDIFRKHGLSTDHLRILNCYHLVFQVARLSDITNIKGTHLYDNVATLERQPRDTVYPIYPHSKLLWPRQPHPGNKVCQLWTKQIHLILLQANGRLRHPLGKWTMHMDTKETANALPSITTTVRQSINLMDTFTGQCQSSA